MSSTDSALGASPEAAGPAGSEVDDGTEVDAARADSLLGVTAADETSTVADDGNPDGAITEGETVMINAVVVGTAPSEAEVHPAAAPSTPTTRAAANALCGARRRLFTRPVTNSPTSTHTFFSQTRRP